MYFRRAETIRVFMTVVALCVLSTAAFGYVLWGSPWRGPIVMHLQLGAWGDAAAASALGEWNRYIDLAEFRVVDNSGAPIGAGNRINNVFAAAEDYWGPIGPDTLALTYKWDVGGRAVESDVIFNANVKWDAYSGGFRGAHDLRRIALHEFGHALGLAHPDEHGQNVKSIMHSRSDTSEHVEADDAAGVKKLYDGTAPAPPSATRLTISGTVTDKHHKSWTVSRATVTGGGRSTTTNAAGQFTLRLTPGNHTITVAIRGYATALAKKSVTRNTTFNVALSAIVPKGTTARCGDRTWSKATKRAASCAKNGGVRYWICPGRLCKAA
jgi:hypothetical protein